MATRRRGPTMIQQSRRKSPAEKAAYHQEAGAGKGRIKRRFFELSASDKAAIFSTLEAGVRKQLKES